MTELTLADPVGLVWEDLENRILTLEAVRQDKIRHYTAQQFLIEAKTLRLPAVSVIYMASAPKSQETGAKSLSVTLQFGVHVIGPLGRSKGGEDMSVTEVTKRIVDVIKGQRAPTGNEYVYGGEFPFDTGAGVGYVHYWNVSAKFTN